MELLLFQIHDKMSLDEIRDIFHVDSHHQVPDYEIINLHQISQEQPKEILENSQSSHSSVYIVKPDEQVGEINTSAAEIKKSKYPKKSYANYQQLLSNKKKQQNVVKIVENNKFINGVNEPLNSDQVPLININGVRIIEENIQLEAFGKKLNLTLKPTDGLIKKGGLKLFMVEPNITSQHGVDYVEVQNVST